MRGAGLLQGWLHLAASGLVFPVVCQNILPGEEAEEVSLVDGEEPA